MPKLTLDLSGQGGLAPRFYGDKFNSTSNVEARVLGTDNMYADGIVNPISKLGYLSPANNSVVAITGDDFIHGTIMSSEIDPVNSKGYMFGMGATGGLSGASGKRAYVYQLDIFGNEISTFVQKIPIDQITSLQGTGLRKYMLNGVPYLYYSFRATGLSGANTSDIGVFNLDGTYDNDWLSTACVDGFNLSSSANHRMIVADNGYMYVLDGSFVHKVDGTTAGGVSGTVVPNVLAFPSQFQCIDATDIRGKMWIAIMRSNRDLFNYYDRYGYYSEYCGVYIWDRKTTTSSFQDFIPITGVKEIRTIFQFRGIPYCITVSNLGHTQLRAFNGNIFEVVKELGLYSYPVFPDSVQLLDDCITWHGIDGIIYCYGKADPELGDALHKIGDISVNKTAGYTYVGAAMLYGSYNNDFSTYETPTCYVAYRESSGATITNKLKKWYPFRTDEISQSPNTGNFFTLVKPLPKLSNTKYLTIFFPKTGTSGLTPEFYINIYFNQSATAWNSSPIAITRDDGARGYKTIPCAEQNVNSIQLGITYNTDSNISATKPTPQYAQLDYEETTKII